MVGFAAPHGNQRTERQLGADLAKRLDSDLGAEHLSREPDHDEREGRPCKWVVPRCLGYLVLVGIFEHGVRTTLLADVLGQALPIQHGDAADIQRQAANSAENSSGAGTPETIGN